MSKKYLIIFFIILINISTAAQSKFNAGASFNLGIPTGAFSDLAITGVGGSLIGEYAFTEMISATLSASYQNFPGNAETFAVQGKAVDFSVNAIPLLAGMRYYFSP